MSDSGEMHWPAVTSGSPRLVQLNAADLSESGPACSCLGGRPTWLLQQGPDTTDAEGSLGAPGGTGLNLQTTEWSLGSMGTCVSIA